MKAYRVSLIPLIIANAVPLVGVLFFDWNLFQIIFLYWVESGVIGFYNILKIVKVSGLLSILLVPFFMLHFGGFMAAHLVFIVGLFAPELAPASLLPSGKVFYSLLVSMAVPISNLFISHGLSFFFNFIRKREYKYTNTETQMEAPYMRIIVMHITLIFGAFVVIMFKQPVLGLVLLIVIKSVIDVRSHIKEHSKIGAGDVIQDF